MKLPNAILHATKEVPLRGAKERSVLFWFLILIVTSESAEYR